VLGAGARRNGTDDQKDQINRSKLRLAEPETALYWGGKKNVEPELIVPPPNRLAVPKRRPPDRKYVSSLNRYVRSEPAGVRKRRSLRGREESFSGKEEGEARALLQKSSGGPDCVRSGIAFPSIDNSRGWV